MACDADLAVMMNIAVADATAGPDPTPAVPAYLAVLDDPPRALAGMDRTLLRDTGIFLDRYVAYQDVAGSAFERKGCNRGLDFAAGRIIGEIDSLAGVVEIKLVGSNAVFVQYLDEGVV